MSHAQPQGYQYSMPFVVETSTWMFIPNVMHVFVDCLCKCVRWKLNFEVLLFLTISSVIDWIEESWNWFYAWCPWKAIHVRVWVSFSFLWQEEFMWIPSIGIFKHIFIKSIPPNLPLIGIHAGIIIVLRAMHNRVYAMKNVYSLTHSNAEGHIYRPFFIVCQIIVAFCRPFVLDSKVVIHHRYVHMTCGGVNNLFWMRWVLKQLLNESVVLG